MDPISCHKIFEWVRNNFFASKICYLCVIERFSFLLNCLTRSPFDPYVCLLVIFTSSDETLHWTWTVGGLLFWNVWICGFNKLWICGMPQMWTAAVLSAVSSRGVELFHMCTKWKRNANPVLYLKKVWFLRVQIWITVFVAHCKFCADICNLLYRHRHT